MKKIKNLTKKIKSEKGSITLFVTISMLFFLIALITNYVGIQNKTKAQEKQIQLIRNQYNITDIDRIYSEAERINYD